MSSNDSSQGKSAAIRARLKFETTQQFIEKYAPNISRTGIFVKTKSPRPEGTRVRFEFQLADGTVVLRGLGQVVWAREEAKGSKPPGMGIKFLKLGSQSSKLIEEAMAFKMSSPHKDAPDPMQEGVGGVPSVAPEPFSEPDPSSGGEKPVEDEKVRRPSRAPAAARKRKRGKGSGLNLDAIDSMLADIASKPVKPKRKISRRKSVAPPASARSEEPAERPPVPDEPAPSPAAEQSAQPAPATHSDAPEATSERTSIHEKATVEIPMAPPCDDPDDVWAADAQRDEELPDETQSQPVVSFLDESSMPQQPGSGAPEPAQTNHGETSEEGTEGLESLFQSAFDEDEGANLGEAEALDPSSFGPAAPADPESAQNIDTEDMKRVEPLVDKSDFAEPVDVSAMPEDGAAAVEGATEEVTASPLPESSSSPEGSREEIRVPDYEESRASEQPLSDDLGQEVFHTLEETWDESAHEPSPEPLEEIGAEPAGEDTDIGSVPHSFPAGDAEEEVSSRLEGDLDERPGSAELSQPLFEPDPSHEPIVEQVPEASIYEGEEDLFPAVDTESESSSTPFEVSSGQVEAVDVNSWGFDDRSAPVESTWESPVEDPRPKYEFDPSTEDLRRADQSEVIEEIEEFEEIEEIEPSLPMPQDESPPSPQEVFEAIADDVYLRPQRVPSRPPQIVFDPSEEAPETLPDDALPPGLVRQSPRRSHEAAQEGQVSAPQPPPHQARGDAPEELPEEIAVDVERDPAHQRKDLEIYHHDGPDPTDAKMPVPDAPQSEEHDGGEESNEAHNKKGFFKKLFGG